MKNINLYFPLLLSAFILFSCQNDKTAFVDNLEIVDNFELLKSKEAFYKEAEDSLKVRIEKIVEQSGYQAKVQKYQSERGKMPKAEEDKLYNELVQLQQSISQQQQFANQELQQRKTQAIDSMIGLVKSFVKEYGKENGYSYIFGNTDSGPIIYGIETSDITDDIVKGLNIKYPVNSSEDQILEEEEATSEQSEN